MEGILIIFTFALGACVGSFLNVVIYRLPRGESIVFPGSHCPACGRPIHWYDNIPLVSWLALRARCRFCKAPISPRYILVELATAVLVCGLFVGFYIAPVRSGAGWFPNTWPMFLAHVALFCGLLACSMVDIESWMIPLEICWFVSLVGLVVAGASVPPEAFLPRVSPTTGALAVGAAVGLGVSLLLLHFGYLQRSFLDAEEPAGPQSAGDEGGEKPPAPRAAPDGVAITSAHGVNPRTEALREVLFLAPAVGLAVVAWVLVTKVPAVREAWDSLTGPSAGRLAEHANALLAALFGYLVGGLWIWGFRIAGTLGFGKEAIGLGDVHILAAVGAVCGWAVPSMAFALAAFLALAWAITIFLCRRQRELPYGPWLAAGALVAVLFYDRILALLEPYLAVFRGPGDGVY
ncbi:MAG TPA: prepilin peptidase [Phycisphaerae bacterium]|nr:prepilin peptidase [Phycisphaerae bacterium]